MKKVTTSNATNLIQSRRGSISYLWKITVGNLLAITLLSSVAHAITLNWAPVNEPGIGGMPVSLRVAPGDSNKFVAGGDMLGPAYSTNGGSSFGRGMGMTMGECADATWAPGSTSTVWMATMGGPYKSTNGGQNWVAKRSGMPGAVDWAWTAPVQKVLINPNNTSHLLAVGGSFRNWAEDNGQMGNTRNYGMIWESANGGESWTRKSKIEGNTGDDNNGRNIRRAEWVKNGTGSVVYAATNSGFYRSDNSGSSWLAKSNGLPFAENTNCWGLAVHPTKPNILWVSVTGAKGISGVYKSTNFGDSWTHSGNGIWTDSNYNHTVYNIAASQQVSSNNTDNPVVMFAHNSNWGDFYRSTDGGANWSKVMDGSSRPEAPTSLGPQAQIIEIDPNNSNNVYVSNSVSIFKSTSTGASGTWSLITAKPGSSSGLWQGNGYSGYVPSRARWNPHSTNTLVLLAMDDGKYMKTTDGVNWKFRGNGVNWWSGGIDVSFAKDNTVYAAFGQWNHGDGVARSTDGGDNWTYVTDPNAGNQEQGAIYVHPDQSNRVWIVRNGKLYYSDNGGSSWSQKHTSVTWFTDIAVDKNNPLTFYLAAKDGVYKTINGNDFTKVASIQWAGKARICIDPNNANRFWFVSSEYNAWHDGVYRYDNGTFTRVSGEGRAFDIAIDPQDSNRVVYITNAGTLGDINPATGVWMTENAWASSPTWIQQNTGLPLLRGTSIAFKPGGGQIIVGLQGAGFFKATTGGTTSGPNLVSNPSFDAENYNTNTPSGWSEGGSNNNAGYTEDYGGSKSGARHGTHWSSYSYTVYTYQVKTGMTNGLYTLRAWAKSGGGQNQCYLEAKDFGGSARTANLPVSSSYQLVEIKDINVTNGQCTIGFWSNANAGNWAYFDDVEFFKQ